MIPFCASCKSAPNVSQTLLMSSGVSCLLRLVVKQTSHVCEIHAMTGGQRVSRTYVIIGRQLAFFWGGGERCRRAKPWENVGKSAEEMREGYKSPVRGASGSKWHLAVGLGGGQWRGRGRSSCEDASRILSTKKAAQDNGGAIQIGAKKSRIGFL